MVLISSVFNKKYLINFYIPFILLLIAFFWKYYYIGARDICGDEPFTIFHAQDSVHNILKLPAQNEPNPPLFMLLLHFWMKLFGNNPISVRTLPLIFNSFTAVYLYLIGKKLINIWAGLFVAGFFLFSTVHFYFGLETRTYSLMVFATSAALYYYMSLMEEPDRKIYFWGLIITNIIIVYAHYFGWFIVVIQLVLSFINIKNNRSFSKKVVIVFITTILLFIPMTYVFIKQYLKSKQGTWVAYPKMSDYLTQLKFFLNNKEVSIIIGAIILIGFIVAFIYKIKYERYKKLLVIFLWWFLPYTFMFIVSFKIPMFINRYLLFNSVGLYVFIVMALVIFFERVKPVSSIIFVFALFIMFRSLEINSNTLYYREVRKAVEFTKGKTSDSTLIIIHPYWTNLGFMYYYNRSIFKDFDHYESKLVEAHIFPVWNKSDVQNIINQYPHNKITYYQDGSLFNDKNNTIYKYLDSVYLRTDSVFYPQCFNVSSFIKKERPSIQVDESEKRLN